VTLTKLRASLARGEKAALAAALAGIERDPDGAATAELLDAAHTDPIARVIGLTGPPGVGKSTLTGALISEYRRMGRTVGCIAVDPSSRRSGGALLGDRTRLGTDPEDAGCFVRSMAARDRLGGLAGLTVAAMVLMRAVYDVVLIETVGVGQSETDIAGTADTVVFCVQPGSGDSLQFMKAGIVEIPDIVAVTKADLGAAAQRARADVKGALSLAEAARGDWEIPVLALSVQQRQGIGDLIRALDDHAAWLARTGRLASQRQDQARIWLVEAIRERFGREGIRRAGTIELAPGTAPFGELRAISQRLL
jgi:LAO/AO transport system kinase